MVNKRSVSVLENMANIKAPFEELLECSFDEFLFLCFFVELLKHRV